MAITSTQPTDGAPTCCLGGAASPTIHITRRPTTIWRCPNNGRPKVCHRPMPIRKCGYGWRTSTRRLRPSRCPCFRHQHRSRTTTRTRTTVVSAARVRSTRSSTKRSPASVSTGCPHSTIRCPQWVHHHHQRCRHIIKLMVCWGNTTTNSNRITTTSTASIGATGAHCIRIAFGWPTRSGNRRHTTTTIATSNFRPSRSCRTFSRLYKQLTYPDNATRWLLCSDPRNYIRQTTSDNKKMFGVLTRQCARKRPFCDWKSDCICACTSDYVSVNIKAIQPHKHTPPHTTRIIKHNAHR